MDGGGRLFKSVEEERTAPYSEEEIAELVERATGMAILYGVQKKITANEFPERVEPMPFTLFPSPIPRHVFTEAYRVQKAFQTVMYKIAHDHEFLYRCLESILQGDEFTKSLWNIYDTVRKEGPNQNISFMMTRNDYMMEDDADDKNRLNIKQVEFNTFASGAGGVIGPVTDLHRYMLSLTDTAFNQDQLPDNQPTVGLAKGMVKAWELYNKPKSVILFVVGIPEPNTPDQRWLERNIYNINPRVHVIYRTFQYLMEHAKLTENKELIVYDGHFSRAPDKKGEGKEIAVVYYRYGYSPKHYPTSKEYDLRLMMERSTAIKCPSVALHLAGCKKIQQEYDLRLMMERSTAIKCPSVALHLAGCKKIQQVLSKPGVLEKFLDDASMISYMRKTFVGQVVLDQDPGAVEKAKKRPERYVLKPQREGGGNNLFSEDLLAQIDNIANSSDASSWILMDRIQAHCHRNRLIRVGLDSQIRDVVSELGIFGVHIGTPKEELANFECGYLLRTKPLEANEGGLFSGHSCLDSPFLIG